MSDVILGLQFENIKAKTGNADTLLSCSNSCGFFGDTRFIKKRKYNYFYLYLLKKTEDAKSQRPRGSIELKVRGLLKLFQSDSNRFNESPNDPRLLLYA
jgi:hypothetical protein